MDAGNSKASAARYIIKPLVANKGGQGTTLDLAPSKRIVEHVV
ncbi:hypothetical protein ACPOL_6853 (plasmid) [Acidisarcina polymorpha]|uniref:Uncharacterized protein n=1 Tax=Acidisarcina polymorpha TaxID=2211140 RepID=A0A2Z5GA96_9BACT|nr:hypothetical protein ACPOL_6853 [Acidisarcina polymorpha]